MSKRIVPEAGTEPVSVVRQTLICDD
jgi:hypothetical protein